LSMLFVQLRIAPDSDALGSTNHIHLDGVDIGLFFDDLRDE
jgi:hypothetical protein